LWNAVRRGHAWTIRGRIWLAVVREIIGVSPRDRSILRRSLLRGLRRIASQPDEWQDPELIEDAHVEARGVGTFQVRAFTDDLYHVLPSREAAVVTAIRNRLRQGGTFIDAGANIGFFTIFAARIVGPDGRVFAIEMLPTTAEQLRRNVAGNHLVNVTVFEHPLSDRDDDVVMAAVPEGKFGRASIVRSSTEGTRVRLKTRALDTLLGDCGPIDILKMDLESAELLALKGAPRVLERTQAVIFEQLADDGRARELLEAQGFRITPLDGSNLLAQRC
jgi:FkbM family methyltransferase